MSDRVVAGRISQWWLDLMRIMASMIGDQHIGCLFLVYDVDGLRVCHNTPGGDMLDHWAAILDDYIKQERGKVEDG